MRSDIWLHRFAWLTVLSALALILIGSLVTTNGAGMAFADWPLSSGSLNPPGWWDNLPMRLEHGHRLFAGFVAALVVVLYFWALARRGSLPKDVELLAFLAVLGVLAQALLGGLRVVLDPQGIKAVNDTVATTFRVLHGCFAQIEFALLVLVASAIRPRTAVTSAGPVAGIKRIRGLAWLTFGFIFLQLVFGATIRHMGIGLVIPYFPKASPTSWMPPGSSPYAHIHFTHSRVIALLIVLHTALIARRVFRSEGARAVLGHPTLVLLLLVAAQIALGISVIWTLRSQLFTTLHVVNGALIFAVSLLLAVRATGLSSSMAQAGMPGFSNLAGRAAA
jgi:cytochrome c oxidase assembly protein subunit 15